MAEFRVSSQTITSTLAMVKLEGDLDAVGYHMLEDEFSKLLEASVPGILIDLSGLASVSSAGLGAFVNLSRLLSERGGKLALGAPSENVGGLIDLLGLADTLTVTATLDEGRKALAGVKA